jgi:Na+/H+ antiporter NhaD/arsenite permease-like protein
VDFIKGILLATLFSLVINFGVILFVYRSEVLQTTNGASQLVDEVVGGGREGEGEEKTIKKAGQKEEGEGQKEVSTDIVMVTETTTTTTSSVTTSSSTSSLPPLTVESSTSSSSSPIPLKRKVIFGILAVLPILLISADSFMGLPWTVTLVGCLLMVTDGDEPDYVLQRVDAQLLLFFSALFVCVAGFDETGIPALVWKAAANAGVGVASLSGSFSFMLLVVIGSNTVSNVPLVLLMAQSVSTGLDVRLTWLMLAFVSTVAGNLTLMGSVANLIVAEKCKDTQYPLTFLEHLKVGVPSTLLVCLIGVPLVWVCAK